MMLFNFLKEKTGKQVITNEIGQLNASPNTLTQIMQVVTDMKLPYAIWYSGDSGPGKAVALHNNNDGSLRPNGAAFKKFY